MACTKKKNPGEGCGPNVRRTRIFPPEFTCDLCDEEVPADEEHTEEGADNAPNPDPVSSPSTGTE